jgi:hypothetical protein
VGLLSGSIAHSDAAVVTKVVGENFATHNMFLDHVANPGTQIIEDSGVIDTVYENFEIFLRERD